VSPVWRRQGVATAALRELRLPDLSNCRHGFSGRAQAVDPVVPGHVVHRYITRLKNGAIALGLQRVLGLRVIRQFGRCCISYDAPWWDRDASASRVGWRRMEPTWAARRRA
jgi:hypothetical protein